MPKFDRQYSSYQPNRPSVVAKAEIQSPQARQIITSFLIIAVSLFAIVFFFVQVAPAVVKAFTPPPKPSNVTRVALATAVNGILQQAGNAQIGVAVQDISDGTMKTFGQNVPFDAASTAKLVTATDYYHLVETGRAKLDAPLGAFTAGFQIKEMINISDNDAWHLLANDIGNDELAAYAKANGINYNVATNSLAPSDMATLLTKLYSGKLLNQADTDQLLSYMQHTNDEDLIPAALAGTGITVYHKYGLLNGELHDAAILVEGNQAYSLVIYTKNVDDSDDQARTDIIHKLATAVSSNLFN